MKSKMSVVKAILFYSRHNRRGLKMKKIIDELEIDMDTVRVDYPSVRQALQEDEKYGIDKIPAVLLIYTTGVYKTYDGKNLDAWFSELIENYRGDVAPPPPQGTPMTMIQPEPEEYNEPEPDYGGMGQMSGAQASMVNTYISGGNSVEVEGPPPPPKSRKEIKQDEISPTEMAKKMSQQREELEEKINQHKPASN